ncbi:hypothetical protein RRG08_019668 [Elysia crispata]|uniref:Uncharacterized protein n=1 Tax=Elysia crispata TaxID=231223 RepID=A0AAE1D5B9_9GAST|nr:hypothetical protein RRG08_019668 [Elysia crispata]
MNSTCKNCQRKRIVSIKACSYTAGQAMPPLHINKGKKLCSLQIFAPLVAPDDRAWIFPDGAGMNDLLRQEWNCNVSLRLQEWNCNVFLRHCDPECPQLFYAHFALQPQSGGVTTTCKP